MTVKAFPFAVLAAMSIGCLVACQPAANDSPASGAAPAAPASETSKEFGDYVVHYNALATDQLTAEVAKSYGIVRSPNRAMLNVSIIKKQDGATGTAVAGSVSASANNLTGQLKQMTIREIREGNAIYYIGEVTVANEEILMFNVNVTPMGEPKTFPTITFQKQFFTK